MNVNQLTLTYFLGGPLGFPSSFFSSGFLSSVFLPNPIPNPKVFFSAGFSIGGGTNAWVATGLAGYWVAYCFGSSLFTPNLSTGVGLYSFLSSVVACLRPHTYFGLSAGFSVCWPSATFLPILMAGVYCLAATGSASATLLTPLKVHCVAISLWAYLIFLSSVYFFSLFYLARALARAIIFYL